MGCCAQQMPCVMLRGDLVSREASCLLSDRSTMCGAGENMGEEAPVLPRKRSSSNFVGAEALEVWRRRRRRGTQAMSAKGKQAAGGQFCELLVVRYLVTFCVGF